MGKDIKNILTVYSLIGLCFLSSLCLIANAIPYDSWNNYKILNFNDGFEGLQVNFNVTYGHGDNGLSFNCKSNFEDLRFFNYINDELLYAYNETTVNGDYVEVWLKLGSSKNVTMRYNNPYAEPYWNKENVFVDVIGSVVLGLPMDEGSGSTVKDYSGNGNNGTITGASWVDGKYGKALSFDGANDFVTVPDHASIDGLTTFCIFGWLNPEDGGDDNERSFSRRIPEGGVPDVPWDMHIKVGNNAWRGIFNTDEGIAVPTASSTVTYSEWQFIMMEWNGSTITFYVNDVAGIPQSRSGTIYAGDTLKIGGVGVGNLNILGIIDSQTIVNYALTPSQKTNLYNNFGDVTLEEGSCLVRVWVDVMPIPVFSIESSNQVNDAILIAILALIVGLCALLLIIIKKK